MFEKCVNCGGSVMLQGRRDEYGVFCSWQCQNYYRHRDFCPTCRAETTDEDAGSTTTVNAVGTKLFGHGDPCPECGSVVQSKCFCVFFPVIPLGKYRALYATPTRYYSRRLVQRLPRLPSMQSPFGDAAAAVSGSQFPATATANAPFGAPAFAPQPTPDFAFRCPACGSPAPGVWKKKISAAGWVLFAVLLLFCFPLCWIGLLLQEQYLECPACRARLAG
jgi:lipopolysaccharide-induced tumor necrosis factor-alpha factor